MEDENEEEVCYTLTEILDLLKTYRDEGHSLEHVITKLEEVEVDLATPDNL